MCNLQYDLPRFIPLESKVSHVSATFHTTPRPRCMLSLIRRWQPVAGERLEHATKAVKGARYPTIFGKTSYNALFLNLW